MSARHGRITPGPAPARDAVAARGMEVRPVRPEEHDEAGNVTAAAYDELGVVSPNRDYRQRLADVRTRTEHAVVLAAVEDGKVLGTVTVELEDRIPGGHPRPPLESGQAHIRMLGVDPAARRRGVGRALMEEAIRVARDAGKRVMTLETTEAMTAAQGLYEAMGFRRAGETVFDDGLRLLDYELPL